MVVVGTCKDAADVAEPLRAAGRLDSTVGLPATSADQRAFMIAADLGARGAHLPLADIQVGPTHLKCSRFASYTSPQPLEPVPNRANASDHSF